MNKFYKVFCSLMLVFGCTLGLFAGCGNPLDNVRISLEGTTITEQDGVYYLNLVRDEVTQDDTEGTGDNSDGNQDGETDSATDLNSAVITAIVEGVTGDIQDSVEWNWDSKFLAIEYLNDKNTEVRISGLNPTTNGTVVTVCSVESDKIYATLVVNVTVKPKSANLATSMANFGIPVGQPYSLNPSELFEFYPRNATVPDYTFDIGGNIVYSNEEFTINTRPQNGVVDIIAYPTHREDYTEEEFNALTVYMEGVRVYTALTNENTYLSLYGSSTEVNELELVENTTQNNETLYINTPNGENVEISIRDPNGINDKNIWVNVNSGARTVSFTGLSPLDEWTEIYFDIKVSGVDDAATITKVLRVRVVDMPEKIILNNNNLSSPYSLNVFDKYATEGATSGTPLVITLSPQSNIYNNVRLQIDLNNTSDPTLVQNLLINGVPFTGEYYTTSGTTLYLRSTGGYGSLTINVIASDTENSGGEIVQRVLNINLQQGVTNIQVDDQYFDTVTGNIVLQKDEYSTQTSYQSKRIPYSIMPATASFDTVNVRSANPSIVTVSKSRDQSDILVLTAVSAGTTQIILTADSGITYSFGVQVVVRLNDVTVNLGDDISGTILGPYENTDVTIGDINTTTLNYAFIASPSTVHLKNTFYPASAEDVIQNISIESTNDGVAYATAQNYNDILLDTHMSGSVDFTITISYYRLATVGQGMGINLETATITLKFTINVFVPITSIDLEASNDLNLLADWANIQSYYDSQRSTADLTVRVYPSNSEVKASSAKWTVMSESGGTTDKLTLSTTSGSTTTVTAQPLTSLQTRITVIVTVTVTDINGNVFSQSETVNITKVTLVSDVLIDEYGDQNNQGLYFELYRTDARFDLNLTIMPSNATNPNVEYIIFDANKLENYEETGTLPSNIIKMDSGLRDSNGQIIYDYYEVLNRTNASNPTQYESRTASVEYDAEKGNFYVRPKNAGYAFLFIVPQDILEVRADTIQSLTPQLQNPSNSPVIRRIPITVADGQEVYYRLYDAEDVAEIGKSARGLSSNYYLMNTIDMSNYLIRNPNWTPIGTEETPFSGKIISIGCDGDNGSVQSIVGWTLRKELTEADPARSPSHTLYYGIFGAVSGEISYVNFYLNNYTIVQTTCRQDVSGNANLGHYDYGLLVGRLIEANGKAGNINNVSVSCANVVYTNNNAQPSTSDLWFNLGAIGLVDTNATVNNFTSNITAKISADNLKVSFGGIAGRNKGLIGDSLSTNYTNYVIANVTVDNLYDDQPDTLVANSSLGIAVGRNYENSAIYGVSVDGSINAGNTSDIIVGGLVAQNDGVLQNSMSSAILKANGIIGGIAGVNSSTITNVAYEIYSTSTTNCGIEGAGIIGGIVGRMTAGSISYAIVQGYNIVDTAPNIVGNGATVGGLVGVAALNSNSTIQNSFVNATLSNSGTLGGLVGSSTGNLTITNVYVRGMLLGENSALGAIAGIITDNLLSTNAVYAEFSMTNDVSATGQGNLRTSAQKTIILVNDASAFTSNDANLIYLNKTSSDATSLDYYVANGFDNTRWNTSAEINGGYPYLLRDDGSDFVRVVPNSISIDARTFDTFTDNRLNSILNVPNTDGTTDTKKIILFYNSSNPTYNLNDLFAFSSDPNLNVADVRMQINCSNTGVIQLFNGATFNDTQIRVVGTGTAVLSFVSSQNNNARDYVQIAVINGFEYFNLYEGADNNGELISNSDPAYEFRIKYGDNVRGFAEYIYNGAVQSSVDGGLKFTVPDNTIIDLGLEGWQEENGEYSYYLQGENQITIVSLKYSDTPLEVRVTPFLIASFYTLDENGLQTGTTSVFVDIDEDEMALNYNTVVYRGANAIAMGMADETTVYADDALVSSVTLFTDNYTEGDVVLEHVGYSVRITGTSDDIINTESGITSPDLLVRFGTLEYDEVNNSLVIPFTVSLSQVMRDTLDSIIGYTITFWALDTDGNAISTMTASLAWNFYPQKIDFVKMEHFSDAVTNGSRLQQAGQEATNTLIAGQYGLLTVQVSPYYAFYDRIEIVSERNANGDRVMFDQRVRSFDENGIATYWSWQQGVEIVENGIALYRVSNIDGTFDGTFYIRTIVSQLQTVGTEFTVWANIYQNGELVESVPLTLTVRQQDTLSLEYPNFNSNVNYAYVAQGTGYVAGGNTLPQNANELTVSVGSSFESYELTVDEVSASYGAQVVFYGGKYYLYTGTVPAGQMITVTLTGRQNMSGLINEVTRELRFLVVNFYISSIQEGLVDGAAQSTTLRFAYVNGRTYDLRIFEGATLENLDTISAITFDPTNETTRQQVIDTINALNGIGASAYSGWYAYIPQTDGTYVWSIVTPDASYADDEWLDGNYRIRNDIVDTRYSGYKLEANGVSNSSRIRYEMYFDYENGIFRLINKTQVTNSSRGFSTNDITLNFYQITSQEHAQPIYSERDLVNMQSGIDYILMNDITITSAWTAITTQINSLNGNGYTITFTPASLNSTTGNYGLFDTIAENTVIKNVNIQLGSQSLALPSSVSSLSSLNFGFIAGVNNGTVYNCQVNGWYETGRSTVGVTVPSPTVASSTFYIAGLVGQNSTTGAISNSRVIYTDITGYGRVAGLVSSNNGTISSSFYTGGTITNVATSTGTNVATAGLVVENGNGATIFGSFVGGAYTSFDAETGKNTLINETRTERDASILSGARTAGFVYSNMGSVSDCYSSMRIWAIEASGFVYTNYTSGTLTRCYTTSILTDTSDEGITSVSMPFIGIEGTQATENNNQNPDGIVNCYFYDTGFSSNALRLEEAKALTLDQMLGNNGSSVFNSYIFSRNGESGSEFTGVWTFVNPDNEYFTPDRFTTYSGTRPQMNFGPKLVSASLIATPRLVLDEEKTTENPDTGAIEYYYNQVSNPYFIKTANADFGTDYSYDPVAITTASQFSQAFDTSLDSVITNDYGENGQTVTKIIGDVRLARNIDQNDISVNTSLNSPNVNYAGIFEGNGFTFENLNLAVNDESVDRYGLFGTVSYGAPVRSGEIAHIGTVKNLNITVTSVSCSQVDYVGALAGIVENANIYNISVTGQNTRVIGNNAVGGVAGKITGTSRANNITANVGVTANYKADTNLVYNEDLLRVTSPDTAANSIDRMGFAGGVFGIADLTQFGDVKTTTDMNEALLTYIYSEGQHSVVGKIAGGLVGVLGMHTVMNNSTLTVDTNTRIYGRVFAGGLVGQNNGVIRYSNVTYTDGVQAAVDIANTGEDTTTNAAGDTITVNNTVFEGGQDTIGTGGLVGLNIGYTDTGWTSGTIYYSSSKIRVRNSSGANVGGIVGVAMGGDIRAVFATGGVYGNRTAYLGGIVGYISNFSSANTIPSGINNPFSDYVNALTTLDYAVALNNYLASDYNYYNELKLQGTGAQGGLVGYCYNAGMIYTTHTNDAGDPSTPYYDLINSINFYVNQIYDRVVMNTVTEEQTTGNFINLNAVGRFEPGTSAEPAKGYVRGYMLANFDEIFGSWDSYSISDDNGMPSIDIKDVPDTLYIYNIDDYRQMYWHPDKNYILMANIDFLAAKTAAVPVGSESAPFTGTFNGNGFTLYNVPMVMTGAMNAGLFGATNGATIQNVNIVNIYISTDLSEGITGYVGGLVGVVRDSTISNVNIRFDDSIEGSYHEIVSRATYTGGMFGRVYATENGATSITNCYVYTNITANDNEYSENTSVYLGGFAGQVEGNVTLQNVYAEGSLTLTNTSITSNNIVHYIGGLVGSTTATTINSAVSNIEITNNNVFKSTYAGGLIGRSVNSNITEVDSASNININLNGLTSSYYLNVGGLLGRTEGDDIHTFAVSSDITIDGTYGVDVDSTTVNSIHAVAGVVGVNSGSRIQTGYSIASIFNNTRLNNIDLAVFEGTMATSVWCDSSLGLTAKDRLELGRDSRSVLNFSTDNMTRPAGNSYARLAVDEWAVFNPSIERYNALYTSTNVTGDSKRAPIMISTAADFNAITQDDGSVYKYYLQLAAAITNIDINTTRNLYGWYNAGGNYIGTQTIDTLDYTSFTPSTNTNYGVFTNLLEVNGKGSILSGAVISVDVSTKLPANANFGGAVGTIGERAKVFGTYVTGTLDLGLSNGTANVGGIVGLNKGQIIGSGADLVINWYGDVDLEGNSTGTGGSGNVGGLVGWSTNAGTRLTFIDSYSIGSLTNHNPNAANSIGGLVGRVSGESGESLDFYNENSYTAMVVADTTGQVAVNPVVANYTSGATNANGIYYERSGTVNALINFTAFNIADQRNGTALDLGNAFTTSPTNNYGLPYFKWLDDTELKDTGNGTVASPYLVNSAGLLAWALSNSGTYYYQLENDIDYTFMNNVYAKVAAFTGYLDGAGYALSNVSNTIIGTLAGSVENIAILDSTASVLLADNVSGTADSIYTNSTTGAVVSGGNITNSLSAGATFGANATNCFTAYPTDLTGLDRNTWVYTGRQVDGSKVYELRTFVDEIGENAKFGTSVTFTANEYLITDIDELERMVEYVDKHGGTTYNVRFVNGTLSLENRYLPTLGVGATRVVINGTGVSDGLIDRTAAASGFTYTMGDSSITSIENMGVLLNGGSIFGATNMALDDGANLQINNSIIYASADGAMLLGSIERATTTNVTMNNVTVDVADGVNFYSVTSSTFAGAVVNVNITNMTANGVTAMTGTNRGTLNINTTGLVVNSNTSGNTTIAATSNVGTVALGNVSATISGVSNAGGIVNTNSGTVTNITQGTNGIVNLTITGENASAIAAENTETGIISNLDITTNITGTNSSAVADNNAGTITNVNINGSAINGANSALIAITNSGTVENVTLGANTLSGDGSAALVITNNGSITANITGALGITANNTGALINANNGNVTVTVGGIITLTGENVAGLFGTYTAGTVTITLNANIDLAGTTVQALALTGGELIDTTTITGTGQITQNGTTVLFPEPAPEPEPEPEPEQPTT